MYIHFSHCEIWQKIVVLPKFYNLVFKNFYFSVVNEYYAPDSKILFAQFPNSLAIM